MNCEALTKALKVQDSAGSAFQQAEIDFVLILAARARVAVPTARLHAELFGIGGVQ